MADDGEDTGSEVNAEVARALAEIDGFLDTFGLDREGEGVGVLLDYRYHGNEVTAVEANVRYIGDERDGDYRFDVSLTYEDHSPDWILAGPYRELVLRVEERYPEAEVHARGFDVDRYV